MAQGKGGLGGIVAGETAICTVGKAGHGLNYRGYDIEELADKSNFEEVAYLLLYGELPDKAKFKAFRERLKSHRGLPAPLRAILERLPAMAHPMDVLRTGCSALGCLEAESAFDQQQEIAERLLGALPSMLLYWHRFHRDGVQLETLTNHDSLASQFLFLLHDCEPDELQRRAMDVSLILYAEHEFNASTFAARVAASTLSDFYSCITAAIGTLRGPLHGGANEAAMELISRFERPDEVEPALRAALAAKEKIMGFGHRVYKKMDPRSPIIKTWSKQLADAVGDSRYFPVSETIEAFMVREKNIYPNLDFYSASTYHFMDIPVSLYTPIFVCSRITGWAAHVFEQRANNALIRPSADYVGPDERPYVPMSQR